MFDKSINLSYFITPRPLSQSQALPLLVAETEVQSAFELIQKLPMPQDTSTLRSFWGLVGFLKGFVEDFVLKTSPLYRFLWKRVEWSWGKQECAAINQLKKSVVTAPALLYQDFNKPFVLDLATTNKNLGAVLSQDFESGR